MNKIKRRKARRELKKRNNKIIFSFLLTLCLLSVGYGAFQTILNINVAGHIVVDERCVVGNVFNFEALDEIQEFKVPCSGIYKLETWGASGGDALTLEGGYGGYSVGNISLKIKEKIYVVVGGEGKSLLELEKRDSNYVIGLVGGYNGGGQGSSGQCGNGTNNSYFRYGASGGGATHISTTSGLLSTLSNNVNNIYIVSAGGGGAFAFKNITEYGAYGPGSSAGGQIGNTAYFTLVTHTKKNYATGGTQTSGGISGNSYNDNRIVQSGSFGSGGIHIGDACDNGSGGGSGYYGGGRGTQAPGAGGSSYIGNPSLIDKAMYCYECEESLDLTKPELFTISTTGDTNYKDTLNCPDGYDENPISKCAKKGNGYARITLISKK